MNITEEKIIETLSDWGYNEEEFEEIVVKLTENAEDTIWSALAEINDDSDAISYSLILTEKGIEIYENWCVKNGHSPNLTGKNNTLEFVDELEESVINTISDWEND